MKQLKLALQVFVLVCGCFAVMSASQSAHAGKAKAVFTNKSSSSITLKVVWTAAGCAGIEYGYAVACGSRKITISGNSSYTYSYNFKWGTSGRNLYVLCNSGSKRLIKEGTKNGRTHTFTLTTGKIIAYRSSTAKNDSCIK